MYDVMMYRFTTKKYSQVKRYMCKQDTVGVTLDEYSEIKKQMKDQLQAVENRASSSASMPMDLAKASNLPAPDPQELADLLLQRGVFPPPSPISVDAALVAPAQA